MGDTARAGGRAPSPSRRYASGLRYDVDPGTGFMYTNHGFAALGQILEDVTGQPVETCLRERIFAPLGMADTGIVRSRLDAARFATGYELRSTGPRPVPDYEVLTSAAGGVSSTPRDMARYLAALLRNDGTLLEPATLRMVFGPRYQPDPRIPGNGLAFFRADLAGHLAVEHDGILPGFDAAMILVPGEGAGVMAFANGARRGIHWLVPEVTAIARRLIGVPDDFIRGDVAHHPDVWRELCGWYRFPASLMDPGRLALGPGVEVFVRGGRPMIRALSPIPALYRGFPLHPDDSRDPYVFRVALPWFGIGTSRVVFTRTPGSGVTAVHVEAGPLSFYRRSAASNPRRWFGAAMLGLLGVAAATKVAARR